DALDAAHAWEFVRRPLDVFELSAFWNINQRIGSLTEIIENDLKTKLRPRTARDDHTISEQNAREGAEWLAAATILCRSFSFSVTDEQTDAASPTFENCLPAGWEPQLSRALANRALFDGASYGRIRFHHRRISEYLAANWLAARMEEGCSSQEL